MPLLTCILFLFVLLVQHGSCFIGSRNCWNPISTNVVPRRSSREQDARHALDETRSHLHLLHLQKTDDQSNSLRVTSDKNILSGKDDSDNKEDDSLSFKGEAQEMKSDQYNQTSDVELSVSDYAPILALCWFVALLSALDRVAMSVAIIPLSNEFHLTDTVKGEISSVFSVGYGLGIIPAGLLVSAVSPRLIMACGVLLWSLATFGTPIAANMIHVFQNTGTMTNEELTTTILYVAENTAPLLLIRSVMGAAESVVLPTIQRILSNWIPASKKSLSIATVFSGFQIGTVCAYTLSPGVMEEFGWRGLFYIYGMIGALWLIPWWLLAKDEPNMVTNETNTELAHLVVEQRLIDENGEEAVGVMGSQLTSWQEATSVFKDAPWKALLTSKATWAVTIAHAANNWGLYNNLSWTPTFYAEQYGLNVKESALLSVLPSVAGAVSGLLAGYTADKILSNIAKDGDVNTTTLVRKVFQSLALLGPAACLLTLASDIPENPATAQLLLTGAVGLQAFNAAGYSSAPQEKAGDQWSGLLYSITTLPGVVFGSIGVYITGQILDATGQNWSGVFGLNAVVDVIGCLAFVAMYNSKKEFE